MVLGVARYWSGTVLGVARYWDRHGIGIGMVLG